MYKVLLERSCGCFNRSSFEKEKEFETQDGAEEYAADIQIAFEEDFCQKHQVNIVKEDNVYKIVMK